MPFRAPESTSLMPETRAEMRELLVVDPLDGAGVSSLMALRTGDGVVSRAGASLMEETMICAEFVLVENAEDPPEVAVVA